MIENDSVLEGTVVAVMKRKSVTEESPIMLLHHTTPIMLPSMAGEDTGNLLFSVR